MIVARDAAAASTSRVGAADSFGLLRWGTAVASMLVSKPVPVAGEWCPTDGVIILEFGTFFRRSPEEVRYSTYLR